MPDGQNALGAKVVAYARAHLHKKVGDGECFALADKALRHAGAKSASDYGEITDDADYVWGDPVDLKDVAPGDVIQFRDFDVDTRVDTTKELPGGGEETAWKERHATRGHHTAIVEQNLGNGKIIILEQHVKPLGPVVQRHTIPISSPAVAHQKDKLIYTTIAVTVTGTIKAFRPHAARNGR
jgi:hypothetical protein